MKKVLVIDDTEEIRSIIAESLKLFGFNALLAGDGQHGIDLARNEIPDLIICDINMPHLDGYQTLSALREDDRTSSIPFIFLSGVTDKMNMRKGMEMGADDYLTKPFTHRELLAAVNARLEKHAEQRRQSQKKLDELRGNITLALPHELRTPLNGIMGLANVLVEDYEAISREDLLESARYIHESALRLHRLIENFLVYSQIEVMRSEAKMIHTDPGVNPFPVVEIVSDVATGVAGRHQRSADLKMDLCESHLFVPGENLAKIVEELVDNSFKFSQPGSLVTVKGTIADREYHISIADQGRGMTAQSISEIGPHMQFDRKTYEQQGAGLGLVIAKNLTELLGGRFDIDSRPGSGTTISLYFLRARSPNKAALQSTPG